MEKLWNVLRWLLLPSFRRDLKSARYTRRHNERKKAIDWLSGTVKVQDAGGYHVAPMYFLSLIHDGSFRVAVYLNEKGYQGSGPFDCEGDISKIRGGITNSMMGTFTPKQIIEKFGGQRDET